MENDLIRRRDLTKFFDRNIRLYEPCPDKYDAAIELRGASLSVPAVDAVEVVHAYWKYCELDDTLICSKCSCEHYIGAYHEYDKNYCPNCGACMDGEG